MNDTELFCTFTCTATDDVISKVQSITGITDTNKIYVLPILNGHNVWLDNDYTFYDLFTSWGSSFNINLLKTITKSSSAFGCGVGSFFTGGESISEIQLHSYDQYITGTTNLTCTTTISYALYDVDNKKLITSIEASEPITKTFTFVEG